MKKIVLFLSILLLSLSILAQNEVSLVVSGEGKDKDEATLNALQSAIEQTYETFVSSNTTILKDKVVQGEIASLSFGNIKEYEYISEQHLSNGIVYVTLNTTVCVDKLVSYCESKGAKAELKGSLFAMEIKKADFNKKAEEKAVENLCKQLETMIDEMYEFEIKVDNPILAYFTEGIYCEVNNYVIERYEYPLDLYCNNVITFFVGSTDTEKYATFLRRLLYCQENWVNSKGMCICEKCYIDAKKDTPLYKVNCKIYVKTTSKFDDFCTTMFSALNEICMKKEEIEKLKSMNHPIYIRPMHRGALYHYLGNYDKKYEFLIPDLDNNYDLFSYYNYDYRKIDDLQSVVQRLKYTGDFYHSAEYTIMDAPYYFRSEKSSSMLNNLYRKIVARNHALIVQDNIKKYWCWTNIHTSPNLDKYYEWHQIKGGFCSHTNICSTLPKQMLCETDRSTLHSCEIEKRNYHKSYFSYANESTLDVPQSTLWLMAAPEVFGGPIIDMDIFYTQEELSQISNITVSRWPKADYYFPTTEVIAVVEKSLNQKAKEEAQKQALQKANDTLQQAIDDYNSLLKKYPYNYDERKISFSLPSNLSDKVSLHDTLHSLLTTIQEQKKLLIEQFSNDSVQYQQLNKNLQAKITEANTELLKYPYNIQQRTIKDSLSIRLFGKTNELSKELETKTENLEEAITQIQQEVYADLKKNNPQRLVEIYYVQNPEQKKTSDNQYLECRCKYNNRLDFDLAFIDNTLPTCDCRETKYQETKHLYHSRDEFDESYNQSESVFKQEVADRESMWQDLNELKRILSSESSLNMKKALSSSKSEITDVLNRVAWQHDSYYYEEAVELIFIYDEKLQKEWLKNGSYFNSKAEMYESWIGDDYANILKKKKKE